MTAAMQQEARVFSSAQDQPPVSNPSPQSTIGFAFVQYKSVVLAFLYTLAVSRSHSDHSQCAFCARYC